MNEYVTLTQYNDFKLENEVVEYKKFGKVVKGYYIDSDGFLKHVTKIYYNSNLNRRNVYTEKFVEYKQAPSPNYIYIGY